MTTSAMVAGREVATMRAYRVVLDPTAAQVEAYERHAGAARAAFNHAVAVKIAAHRKWRQDVAAATYLPDAPADPEAAEAWARKRVKTRIPSSFDNMLTFKATHPWHHEVCLRAIAGGLDDADRAWRNWLDSLTGKRTGRRVGYPRLKSRHRARQSFRLVHSVKVPTLRPDGYRRLNLPAKVGGSVRLKGNIRHLARRIRRGVAEITSVVITRHGHRWIASILTREYTPLPVKPTARQDIGGTVGVDVGVKVMAALSTGELVPNPRSGRRAERRLVKAQRALSRSGWIRHSDGQLLHDVKDRTKRTPTQGRRAAQARLAKAHALLVEQRAQALHRLTKRLATGHRIIAVEDLNVAGMTRTARGTLETPGRNVRAKAGLNRAILDVSFAELRRQLAYKTGWYGSRLVVTPRFAPTSKTCSTCGWRDPNQTLRDRTFHCARCGLTLDRDLNAARNIARLAEASTDPGRSEPHTVAPEKEETQNARRAAVRPAPRARRTATTTREDQPPHGGRSPRPSNRPPIPTPHATGPSRGKPAGQQGLPPSA